MRRRGSRKQQDAFWTFVAERHAVWHRRFVERTPPPWTDDPFIAAHHFTNVYRELDPGTEWLMHRLRRRAHSTSYPERLLNTLVYRMGLHEASAEAVGWLRLSEPPGELAAQVREALYRYGAGVWTPAYMVSNYGRRDPKIMVFGGVVVTLAENVSGVWAEMVASERQHRYAHEALARLHGIGRFLAFQVLVDCCYPDSLLGWGNDQWATCGPGAWRGLGRIFPGLPRADEQEALMLLSDASGEELYVRGMRGWAGGEDPTGGLTLANIQNCLCEWDKYERIAAGKRWGRLRKFDANQRLEATT